MGQYYCSVPEYERHVNYMDTCDYVMEFIELLELRQMGYETKEEFLEEEEMWETEEEEFCKPPNPFCRYVDVREAYGSFIDAIILKILYPGDSLVQICKKLDCRMEDVKEGMDKFCDYYEEGYVIHHMLNHDEGQVRRKKEEDKLLEGIRNTIFSCMKNGWGSEEAVCLIRSSEFGKIKEKNEVDLLLANRNRNEKYQKIREDLYRFLNEICVYWDKYELFLEIASIRIVYGMSLEPIIRTLAKEWGEVFIKTRKKFQDIGREIYRTRLRDGMVPAYEIDSEYYAEEYVFLFKQLVRYCEIHRLEDFQEGCRKYETEWNGYRAELRWKATH